MMSLEFENFWQKLAATFDLWPWKYKQKSYIAPISVLWETIMLSLVILGKQRLERDIEDILSSEDILGA